jgi:hypothetical protein
LPNGSQGNTNSTFLLKLFFYICDGKADVYPKLKK